MIKSPNKQIKPDLSARQTELLPFIYQKTFFYFNLKIQFPPPP